MFEKISAPLNRWKQRHTANIIPRIFRRRIFRTGFLNLRRIDFIIFVFEARRCLSENQD